MVEMLTHLNKGESGLFDALNNDWADTSRSHKVELGQLLWNMMTVVLIMMTVMCILISMNTLMHKGSVLNIICMQCIYV